jgi:hypothetical protein
MSNTPNEWDSVVDDAAEDGIREVVKESAGDAPPEPTEDELREKQLEEFQKEAQERHDNTCPKCSWDIRNKVLKAKEEDLKEYTRCLLAGRCFVKSMELYGGHLSVEFTENDDDTRDEIVRLVQSIDYNKLTQLDVMTLTRKIQVVFCLTKMAAGDDTKSFEVPSPGALSSGEDVEKEFKERLGGRTASVQATLFRAYLEFDKLIAVLSDGAFDENFYQGAGLD